MQWCRKQETHSLSKEKKRISDFQGQTFFPHGEPNYCEVDMPVFMITLNHINLIKLLNYIIFQTSCNVKLRSNTKQIGSLK